MVRASAGRSLVMGRSASEPPTRDRSRCGPRGTPGPEENWLLSMGKVTRVKHTRDRPGCTGGGPIVRPQDPGARLSVGAANVSEMQPGVKRGRHFCRERRYSVFFKSYP